LAFRPCCFIFSTCGYPLIVFSLSKLHHPMFLCTCLVVPLSPNTRPLFHPRETTPTKLVAPFLETPHFFLGVVPPSSWLFPPFLGCFLIRFSCFFPFSVFFCTQLTSSTPKLWNVFTTHPVISLSALTQVRPLSFRFACCSVAPLNYSLFFASPI